MAIIRPTRDDSRRITRTVERVERMPVNDPPRAPLRSTSLTETHWVQITSTTQTDGRYPGSLYLRDGNGATFTLLSASGGIWVDTPNGESLTTGVYYPARIGGEKASDSKPIFDVIASAKDAFIRGKLDGTLSYQGSATMSIWWYNGSAEADSTENVTVYDWLLSTGQTIASGKQVTAAWDSRSGRYYVTGAQCV